MKRDFRNLSPAEFSFWEPRRGTLLFLREFYDLRLDEACWRRTDEELALLRGLEHLGQVKILATNGNLAYYETSDGAVFDGHIQHFEGAVRPWGSAVRVAAARKTASAKPKTKPADAKHRKGRKGRVVDQQSVADALSFLTSL